MPSQIEPILSSVKVELIVGDITKPNFGICPKSLDEIATQTTIIIHSAPTVSKYPPLQSSSWT